MTDPTTPKEAETAVDAGYLIRKGGYFYRPNAQGYTTCKAEAGRYTLADAIRYTHPNGPDGPRDELSYERDHSPAPSPSRAAGEAIPEEAGRDGCIGSMTPERATYFLGRFKREEKWLGPHEQWALDYAIRALAAPPAPSEQPAPSQFGGGHADTEGEAMAMFAHLNCPACGGSGHVDDVQPAPSLSGEVERLRGAAQDVINQAFDYYTARNGHRKSIEGDDGEKCWIIPSDAFEQLKYALAALSTPVEQASVPQPGKADGATIVLISSRNDAPGYQTHGLFDSFDAALDHAKKDGVSEDASWVPTGSHRRCLSDDGNYWVASREPIRVAPRSTPPAPRQGEGEAQSTVAFVQEWLMNADYDPSQFDKDFAAAIDARCAALSPALSAPEGEKPLRGLNEGQYKALGYKFVAPLSDWFIRNADRKNPNAAINRDAAYFGDECAAMINGVVRAALQGDEDHG